MRQSTGPPNPTPIARIFSPAVSFGIVARICSRIPSPPRALSTAQRSRRKIFPSALPRTNCSFVPPISMPRSMRRLNTRGRGASSCRSLKKRRNFRNLARVPGFFPVVSRFCPAFSLCGRVGLEGLGRCSRFRSGSFPVLSRFCCRLLNVRFSKIENVRSLTADFLLRGSWFCVLAHKTGFRSVNAKATYSRDVCQSAIEKEKAAPLSKRGCALLKSTEAYFFSSVVAAGAASAGAAPTESTHSRIASSAASPWRLSSFTMRV